MYAPELHHLLHYKISTDSSGVRLRIWELANGSSDQEKTYLYIINHRLASLDEAREQLRHHLNLNGGILTQDQEIPRRGQIKLFPHPTLEY